MALDTTTELFDGRPFVLTTGAMRDMFARAGTDGWVFLTVNVRLADGAIVTRAPARVRVSHEVRTTIGFEVIEVALDVDARADVDPKFQLAHGMNDEDEYWDRVSCD